MSNEFVLSDSAPSSDDETDQRHEVESEVFEKPSEQKKAIQETNLSSSKQCCKVNCRKSPLTEEEYAELKNVYQKRTLKQRKKVLFENLRAQAVAGCPNNYILV